MSAALKSSKNYVYKVRVGGVSPRCGIEQICEGGIGSSAHSQSEQYLIRERFVPPTKRRFWGQCSSKVLFALGEDRIDLLPQKARLYQCICDNSFWGLLCTHTHYGIPFLSLSAYKARVGGVSLWCGIEQIHVGGSKGRRCLSQSRQYLIGEKFVSPTKRRIFVGGMNLAPIRYCSRFLFSLWYKCFFFFWDNLYD